MQVQDTNRDRLIDSTRSLNVGIAQTTDGGTTVAESESQSPSELEEEKKARMKTLIESQLTMPYLKKDANWVLASASNMGSIFASVICTYKEQKNILGVQSISETLNVVDLCLIGGLCCIGSFVAGFHLERIKRTLLITNLLLLTGIMVGAWPNKYCFYLLYVVQGFCAGVYSVAVPRYLLYQQPLYRRHKASVSVMLFILLGVFVMSLVTILLNFFLRDQELLVWWLQLSFRAFYIAVQTIMLKWVYSWELPVYYYKQYLQACDASEDVKKYL